jgi:hypothetical protein
MRKTWQRSYTLRFSLIIRFDREKKLSQFRTGNNSPYLVKRRKNKIIQAIEYRFTSRV